MHPDIMPKDRKDNKHCSIFYVHFSNPEYEESLYRSDF